jgi:hypothetical protein
LDWINSRTAPRRLYADYEFPSAHASLAKDFYGVTDGYLEGNPAWISFDGKRSGFLNFNGSNQYVILDRSLSDLREISMTAWVKWSGGASNQPVFYFGSATNNCLFFTPDNGAGRAKFIIRHGGVEQDLTASVALITNVWTHIAVTLSNAAAGRLYINGILQQEGNITITPDEINAPNVNTAAQYNFLARGADNSQPFFNGAIDGFRVYTGPLTDAEISAMQNPNNAPKLDSISDQVANAGVVLRVTNSVSDADLPWQTLTFSLQNAPAGAAIDPETGIFSWRPSIEQAGTTYLVSVKVSDNGAPSLSATQEFSVIVNPLNLPELKSISARDGRIQLQISGDFGPDYSIQTSTNLTDWTTVFTTNSPALPFDWNDPESARSQAGFYRVLLGP